MQHVHGEGYQNDGGFLPRIPLREDLRQAAQRQYLDNEAALYARLQAAGLQLIGNPGLVADIATILVERSTIPTSALCDAFAIGGARIMEIHDAEPISVFSCLVCGDPLPDLDRPTLLRRIRAQNHVLRRAEAGEPVSPEALYALLCGRCANDHQRHQDEQRRAEREALEARRRELRTMPYPEYLKTPEWRALRNCVLRIAGYRCKLSDACEGPVEVHHRTYARRGGNELLEDLIVLCRVHHQRVHGIMPGAA